MGKLKEEKLIRLLQLLLKEAGPNDPNDEELDEPADQPTGPSTTAPARPAAPTAAPTAPAKSANPAPARPAPSKPTAPPAAPSAPVATADNPAGKKVAVPGDAPAPTGVQTPMPAKAAKPAAPAPGADAPVSIPGMDNEEPTNANAAAVDADQKVQQAKVQLFFDKLAGSPQIMNYLSFTNPLEQAAAIQKFAELVGVPKGQLTNVLAGIQQAADAGANPGTTSEAMIRRIIKVIREANRRNVGTLLRETKRDTSWAVKKIEEFVANNEGVDGYGDGEEEYKPTIKLTGPKPVVNFNVTFGELKAIAKLLRRLGGGSGGGVKESFKRK